MIISVNWLKKFVPNLPEIGELSRLIGARLVEIEGVENLGEKYKDVIIARVVSAEKVEGSDHLNLCKIDDGGVRSGVNRDQDGLIQVVCGAPNVRAGIFVAWLPPESIVPETFGNDNFKLGARKLMGNMSNGMIASLRELALGDEHDGILEILPEVFGGDLSAGDSFAEKFELNDFLLEVENKSLTHRPDCFGIIGFAREVAGILGREFQNPDFFKSSSFEADNSQNISIEIQNPELCKRYTATTFDVSEIVENPDFTLEKTYLLRSGMRPIDTITDLANLSMLETGQPLHTFDFEKLQKLNGGESVKMVVRGAFENEKLELLDGKIIEMAPSDIVIATGKNGEIAVALAGAMGGASTKIDENTRQILLESATFNLYNLRNTQMRHGIFSEAITRFTKGVPEMMTRKSLDFFGENLIALGGRSIGWVADSGVNSENSKGEISVSDDKINAVLGAEFSSEEIRKTLANVGIVAKSDSENIFEIPFWRNDLKIEEDLIEEVGRLNGYDNIGLTLPKRDFRAVESEDFDKLQTKIRQILSSAGANEVLTYSFIHGDLLEKFGQNKSESYRIINSISPDLQYYRQTLTPSLLSKISQNIRGGYDEFAIFEINKLTLKPLGLDAEGVPNEIKNLAFAYTAKKGEHAFYQAKYFLNFLLEKLGLKLAVKQFDSPLALHGGWEPKRSAFVGIKQNGQFVNLGVLGEFKKSVQKGFKLPEATAGFEVNLEKLLEVTLGSEKKLKNFSKFQSVERDLSVRFTEKIDFAQVQSAFESKKSAFENTEIEISPLDIFEKSGEITFSFRFKITPFEKTLTSEEINNIMEVLSNQGKKLGGEIV
ncbi:MAG: phenylalanine--tRNA ligase subunit beta [bacterium]|nr:phenylalanine--tRNA ligase subunit beta [bacterium]